MAGGIFYNNVSQNSLFYNNVEQSACFFNNTQVWKKDLILHPGNTWDCIVNQNDGGSGHDASASVAGSNMVLVGGYNGSSARCAKWVDIGPWTTLSVTVSANSLSNFQLRWGVYSSNSTNIYSANEIRVTKKDGATGNFVGTHTINVSDLTGGVYIMVYLYSGSSVAPNQITFSEIKLS